MSQPRCLGTLSFADSQFLLVSREVVGLKGLAMPKKTNKANESWTYEPVPSSAIRLFRMAWQLEAWLRTMVYVELRAARVDWEEPIKKCIKKWPPYPQAKDKELTHMTTHHQGALSYLSFGELWTIISDNNNWPLFEIYFPPEANTAAKIEEIKTIRNRVAHYREPHQYDEARYKQFLQDMDAGLRRFCNRYTTGVYSMTDPVSELLENSWEGVGYGYELFKPDRTWLYAPGNHRMDPLMHATLDILIHNRYKVGSSEGMIYKLEISPGVRKGLNLSDFLSSTRQLHSEAIHVMVKSDIDVAVTIPAIHGLEKIVELLKAFLSAGINSSHSNSGFAPDFERLQVIWPEYILWPDHLLSFYDNEIRAPICELPE